MRTTKPKVRQPVSWERDARRRMRRLPGPASWAVREYLADCHEMWSAIRFFALAKYDVCLGALPARKRPLFVVTRYAYRREMRT